MGIYLWAVISMAMIMFPLVKLYFRGTTKVDTVKGCVIGVTYSTIFFGATIDNEDEPRAFQLHSFHFHFMFLTISMAFSELREDLTWEEGEDE